VFDDLSRLAKLVGIQLTHPIFLAAFLRDGVFAAAPTVAAETSASGVIAVGYSSLRGGPVQGYFCLETILTANGAPEKFKIMGMNGNLITRVELQYEGTPPAGTARKIRIESIFDMGNGQYEVDGSILLSDGWHKFRFVIV
jgi:hypothetical protein